MVLLIADDNAHKTMLMQGMLHRMKWKGDVLIATTTEDAKKLIDEQEIGFGLIDYYIPTENGPSVIAYLKSKNPNARIALVSSSDKIANFDEAKAVGAEACICTGYEADEVERKFVEVLNDWIESKA